MLNLVLLGPPGCGKGTQAERVADKFNLYKLSTGDLVRAEIASSSDLGKEIQAIVEAGNLPSDTIILGLIEAKVKELVAQGTGIIFDGVPRTLNQAEKIEDLLQSVGTSITHVIELAVDDQVLIDRIAGRFTCVTCGAGYNDKFKKPKVDGTCDTCGSQSFKRRSDDREEVVRQRLEVYGQKTAPLVEFYTQRGLHKSINGMRSVEDVAGEIEEILSAAAKVGAMEA